MSLTSCSSDEEYDGLRQNTQSNVVRLSNGEVITLTDTVTYTVDMSDLEKQNVSVQNISNDLFDKETRASSSLRAYGYDKMTPESDWRKYYLTNMEEYGIDPRTIYIGRYIKVYKDLSIEKGSYAIAADYTSDNAPKNVMGWEGKSKVVGFTPTTKSDYIAEGETRVFFLNSDINGISYNKYIPADPNNFVWAYKVVSKADIWD